MVLMLIACIPKAAQKQAPEGTEIAWVHWMETEDGVVPLPKAVQEKVQRSFWSRGIRATETGDAAAIAALPPEARIQQEPMALVGCSPVFDTQVNGRLRWRVTCDITMADKGKRIERKVDTVAYLLYYQQREEDALLEVSAGVQRSVGKVLDGWLSL